MWRAAWRSNTPRNPKCRRLAKYMGRKVASSVRDAKRSPSRVVLSPKVRLCLQVSCSELSAAFRGRPKVRVWYQRAPFQFRS
jgi:hypothetical protein